MEEIQKLKFHSKNIRLNILEMLYLSKSGHTAGSLDLADLYCVLYSNFLKYKKDDFNFSNRDYVIVSNGHTCPVFYSTLIEFNLLDKKHLKTLRKYGSILQGHPHNLSHPLFLNSGGPLGQGISQAVGLASSLKRENRKNRVFCFVGDGELEEGQVWEALLFANKEKLDNLIIIIDRNKIQIDGTTKSVLPLEPLHRKFSSFGCLTIDFCGNDINQIKDTFEKVLNLENNSPKVLIAKTTPGFPVSFFNSNTWHGKTPNKEEYEKAKLEIEEKYRKDLILNINGLK